MSGQERPWQHHEQHILLLHPLPRGPLRLPEVSPADVGDPGAAHGAGLDQVLGCQHDGLDSSLHRHLVVLHREGAEQAGSPRQVRAPAPGTEQESLRAHWGIKQTPQSKEMGLEQRGCTNLSPHPSPHRSTMQSLRGCGAMLSIT